MAGVSARALAMWAGVTQVSANRWSGREIRAIIFTRECPTGNPRHYIRQYRLGDTQPFRLRGSPSPITKGKRGVSLAGYTFRFPHAEHIRTLNYNRTSLLNMSRTRSGDLATYMFDPLNALGMHDQPLSSTRCAASFSAWS